MLMFARRALTYKITHTHTYVLTSSPKKADDLNLKSCERNYRHLFHVCRRRAHHFCPLCTTSPENLPHQRCRLCAETVAREMTVGTAATTKAAGSSRRRAGMPSIHEIVERGRLVEGVRSASNISTRADFSAESDFDDARKRL